MDTLRNSFEQRPLFLGSQSPRRKQLLAEMGFEFEVITIPNLEENYPPELESHIVPTYLSNHKAAELFAHIPNPNGTLITADTVVIINNEILGKPETTENAFAMLSKLSGHTHEVITGVTIKNSTKQISFSDTTEVTFRALTNEEINYYIDNYKPFDKAGSYGIQEWIGLAGISSINGSYFNVVGLPTEKLFYELTHF